MPAESPTQKLAKLSQIERQVLSLVCDGFLYKDIAKKVFLSEPAIRSVMGRVYIKLELDQLDKAVKIREIHQVYCPLLKDDGAMLEPVPPKQERPDSVSTEVEPSKPVVLEQIPTEPVSPEPTSEEITNSTNTVSPEKTLSTPEPIATEEQVKKTVKDVTDEDDYEISVINPKKKGKQEEVLTEVISIPESQKVLEFPHQTPRRPILGFFVGMFVIACILIGIFLLGNRFFSGLFHSQPSAATQRIPVQNTSIPLPTSGQLLPSATQLIQENPTVPTNSPQPTTPVLPTSTIPSISLPFLDNFDSGVNPAWRVLSGDWLTANQRYTISNADNTWGFSVLDDSTWTDYRIRVSIQLETSWEGEVAIIVRNSESRFLTFHVINILSQGGWAYYDGNSFSFISGDGSIDVPDQFDLELEVIGQEFIARINGMETQRLSLSGYTHGGVGLGVKCYYPPCASFSDFQVNLP